MKTLPSIHPGWGASWVALSLALALHVWDEAAHDFLGVYNPTVLALREQLSFMPLPTFTFGAWLSGLIVAVVVLLLLSVFAFRGSRWLRPIAYGLAVLMLLNGVLHLAVSVYDGEMMPGAYSAPVLMAAAVWLMVQLRASSPRQEVMKGTQQHVPADAARGDID
jgi:ABC-type Fe3+-siderophore transport system permease subunit